MEIGTRGRAEGRGGEQGSRKVLVIIRGIETKRLTVYEGSGILITAGHSPPRTTIDWSSTRIDNQLYRRF